MVFGQLQDRGCLFGYEPSPGIMLVGQSRFATVNRVACLVDLQAYGASRVAEAGSDDGDPVAVVRRVLKNRI